MTSPPEMTSAQLEVLHDHYKETFGRIRDAEASRDRLFLALIATFGLLIVEVGYPAAVGTSLATLSILGGELNLSALPLGALLDASWVLTLTIGLRYCQTTVLINRQYPYLDLLEQNISVAVGGGSLYRREGKIYLEEYPFLLDVAWVTYGFVFPVIIMTAAITLAVWEFRKTPFSVYHRGFDLVLAVALIFVFFAYRVYPSLSSRWKQRRLKASG